MQSSLFVGWKKEALIKQMSNAVKSVSSNLVQLLVNSSYRFSEQPALNEVNIAIYKLEP